MNEQLLQEFNAIAANMAMEAYTAGTKHAAMASRHEAYAVILEELDEFWDLVKLNPKKPMIHPTKGYHMLPEMWKREMRTELIQTAAMCLRTIKDLDL